jgi:hypothetical protein
MSNERVSLKRRPFLTPIWLTALFALLAFGCFLILLWLWGTADSTTVLVTADPPSDAEAQVRASALARAFGETSGPGRIDAVYFAAPAQHLPDYASLMTTLRVAPRMASADDARTLAHRALHEHRGGRVLIISDRVTQGLIEQFSGLQGITASGERAGILYVISVPRIGQANLLRLNY